MPTAADVIARHLYDAGCRFAFGIPGGEVLTVLDAIERAGIRFVLTRHETPAGFMAEGTHHATGAPGVLLATVGPGVTNAVNVIANAWQDRVPLIFLTGCVDAKDAATYTHQVFDHTQLLRPITKASFTAVPEAIDAVVDKAIAIATDDQPGPVHIDVPIGVAAASVQTNRATLRVRPSPAAPAAGPDLETARNAFATAERPLVIAGLDALYHQAEEEIAALVHDFGIPLITTYKGKGIVPEDHALALGGAGLSPKADKHLLGLVRQSDFVLLAGYDPIEMRIGWRDPWGADAMVVEFTSVPNTHYMHQARLSFVGHVGAGIEALRKGLKPHPVWSGGEPQQVRAALKSDFAGKGWGPAAVVEVARQAFPRDTVAAVDSGAHRILLSQTWECYAPRTLMQSTGLCTMGGALPLAIGYKLANPSRPAVAFTGDAGLEMVIGELATLRDLRIPIVVIVFVDDSLALIELKQRSSGLANKGVDFGGTDFSAVARGFGGVGVVAADKASLTKEINAALARDTFTVISCPIGRRAYDGAF